MLCGFRGKDEQNAAADAVPPTSKLRWPHSKHNRMPYALAVDLAPYPVRWTGPGANERFVWLRERVAAKAAELGVRIRHISWDLPHTELADEHGT